MVSSGRSSCLSHLKRRNSLNAFLYPHFIDALVFSCLHISARHRKNRWMKKKPLKKIENEKKTVGTMKIQSTEPKIHFSFECTSSNALVVSVGNVLSLLCLNICNVRSARSFHSIFWLVNMNLVWRVLLKLVINCYFLFNAIAENEPTREMTW